MAQTKKIFWNNGGPLNRVQISTMFKGSGGPLSSLSLADGSSSADQVPKWNKSTWSIVNASTVGLDSGTKQGVGGVNAYNIIATNDGALAGNTRGEYSVDLQTKRSNAAKVASGGYSIIFGGYNNRATQFTSFVSSGSGNSATQYNSGVLGGKSLNSTSNYATALSGNKGGTYYGYNCGIVASFNSFTYYSSSAVLTSNASSTNTYYCLVSSSKKSAVYQYGKSTAMVASNACNISKTAGSYYNAMVCGRSSQTNRARSVSLCANVNTVSGTDAFVGPSASGYAANASCIITTVVLAGAGNSGDNAAIITGGDMYNYYGCATLVSGYSNRGFSYGSVISGDSNQLYGEYSCIVTGSSNYAGSVSCAILNGTGNSQGFYSHVTLNGVSTNSGNPSNYITILNGKYTVPLGTVGVCRASTSSTSSKKNQSGQILLYVSTDSTTPALMQSDETSGTSITIPSSECHVLDVLGVMSDSAADRFGYFDFSVTIGRDTGNNRVLGPSGSLAATYVANNVNAAESNLDGTITVGFSGANALTFTFEPTTAALTGVKCIILVKYASIAP